MAASPPAGPAPQAARGRRYLPGGQVRGGGERPARIARQVCQDEVTPGPTSPGPWMMTRAPASDWLFLADGRSNSCTSTVEARARLTGPRVGSTWRRDPDPSVLARSAIRTECVAAFRRIEGMRCRFGLLRSAARALLTRNARWLLPAGRCSAVKSFGARPRR